MLLDVDERQQKAVVFRDEEGVLLAEELRGDAGHGEESHLRHLLVDALLVFKEQAAAVLDVHRHEQEAVMGEADAELLAAAVELVGVAVAQADKLVHQVALDVLRLPVEEALVELVAADEVGQGLLDAGEVVGVLLRGQLREDGDDLLDGGVAAPDHVGGERDAQQQADEHVDDQQPLHPGDVLHVDAPGHQADIAHGEQRGGMVDDAVSLGRLLRLRGLEDGGGGLRRILHAGGEKLAVLIK